MKLILVIVSIFATSLATGPPTPAVIDKVAACLDVAALVDLPTVNVGVSIDLLGLLSIGVNAKLDCSSIAAQVRLATELSYNESTSGNTINFNLVLQVALNADLTLNAGLSVRAILGIEIGVGLCVIGYVDVVINLNVSGSFDLNGNPSDCTIQAIDCGCTKGGSWLTSSGDSIVGSAVGSGETGIKDGCFAETENKLNSVLKSGLVSA